MNKGICLETLRAFQKQTDENPQHRPMMNAIHQSGLDGVAVNYDLKRRMRHTFSLELTTGKITSQNSSGRCWMFAALNTMRAEVMEKLNLETFEFSQAYPLFFDKLEKSNWFLENILETLDVPTDDRVIAHLLGAPLNDGGQWEMFSNLIRKYGVVPKDCMPESFHSSNTGTMNKFLQLKLKEYACTLREQYAAGTPQDTLAAQKKDMLFEIYRMLCLCLGTPPTEAFFEGYDKDKNFVRVGPMAPTAFFQEYVGWDLDDYVSLIHAPTADKPYYNTFTVRFLGNVAGGREVKHLNLPVEEVKQAAIAQMQDKKLVWFGCDVGQMLSRSWGTMDMQSADWGGALGTCFPMNKAQRLDYGESAMTHAMVFCGVNLDQEGKPNRWKVENSWGDKAGNDGQFLMSDEWFSEYTYQVVVHKKYLTQQQREAWEQTPHMLKPWDPMGSLA